MDAAKIHDALVDIARLEAELAAARRAPPSHDEQLTAAKRALTAAGEQFARQPFRPPYGGPAAYAQILAGAFMFLTPMAAIEAVEKAIRAGPPGIDAATRQARIAAAEKQIAALVRSLSYDDLRQLRREQTEAHTFLRSLRARVDELQNALDRRQLAIGDYSTERDELRRQPRRVAYFGDPPQPGREERDLAGEAADRWLAEAAADLAADQRTLDEVRTRHQVAGDDWRRLSLWVEQLEKLLPVLPAPLNMEGADA